MLAWNYLNWDGKHAGFPGLKLQADEVPYRVESLLQI